MKTSEMQITAIHRRLSVGMVLAFAVFGASLRAADVQETFQKALIAEEVNHDLESAIQSYQSVLDQLDQQRTLAATTVFRLGESYRKLGKTNDAVAQYQRVLREFSDQSVLVRLSEQNLSALGAPPISAASDVAQPSTNIEAEKIRRIQEMIKNSPDLINAASPDSFTPLQEAARNGQLAVALFLLQNGAAVDGTTARRPETPLSIAASHGHKAIVELLLRNGADINASANGSTALHQAASKGFIEVAKVLLAHNANPNLREDVVTNRDPLPLATSGNPLHYAADRGDLAMSQLLIDHGAEVNAENQFGATPLLVAAREGNLKLAELFLDKGADPNPHIKVNAVDVSPGTPYVSRTSRPASVRYFTPLHFAVTRGSHELAELLLKRGAQPNAPASSGNTPLHLAVLKADLQMIALLVAQGANLNAQNLNQYTPVHSAVELASKELLEMLLAHKADPNLKDALGNTPLHYAVLARQKPAIELLLAHKADPNLANGAGKTPMELFVRPASSPSAIRVPVARSIPSVLPSATPASASPSSSVSELVDLLRRHGANGKGPYAPNQATGAPDAENQEDPRIAAWFPSPGGTEEAWLQLEYEDFVDVMQVVVVQTRETVAPMPIARIAAILGDGSEENFTSLRTAIMNTTITGSISRSTREVRFIMSTPTDPIRTKTIKLYFDPDHQGENGIDAVAIVSAANDDNWAVSATASSSLAD